MYEIGEEKKPDVLSGRNVALALAIHLLFFVAFWTYGCVTRRPKESIIPIDLTLVVNENLEGKDNEPPPTRKVEPPKPKPPAPKPKPKPAPPKPEPPKIDSKMDALEKTQVKTNVVKKVEKPKKKTQAERIKEMQEKAKLVKDDKKSKKKETPKKSREEEMRSKAKIAIELLNEKTGDGRTDKKTLSDAEIRRLLNMGYKAGTREQLASSEEQRCLSLIQMALNSKWEQLNPQIGSEGTVYLSINFDANGRLVNCQIRQSCGDKLSDRAALMVAQSVGRVNGLSQEFITKFRSEKLTIRYKVQGR